MITKEFEARIKRVGSTDVSVGIGVTLTYDADIDPFAVEAVFSAPDEPSITWYFSRDLLLMGSVSLVPYGSGDVKFRLFPDQGIVMVCLRSPEGHADVALPKREIEGFLEATIDEAVAAPEACTALVDEFLKELFEA